MKKHLIFVTVGFLGGCASFSNTADEFRVQHPKLKSFCAKANAAEAFASLQSNLKRCYEHTNQTVRVNAMLSTPTYEQWIESKPSVSGGSHSIVTKDGYVLVADVSPGDQESCPAKVEIYLLNGMWNRHVSFLEKATQPGEPSCPM